MAFQQPASLPDYSKLVSTLATSGVQKWNPALYDILKQLIGAVQQSQDVISTNLDNVEGFTGVSVDAAGALSGDGTIASPLAVKVDGATITIVGDQLVAASAGGMTVSISSKMTISNAQIAAGASIPNLVAAPGAGLTIVPLFGVAYSVAPALNIFTTTRDITLGYGASSASNHRLINFAGIIAGGSTQDARYIVGLNNGANILFGAAISADSPPNKSIDVFFSGANSPGGVLAFVTIQIVYVTLPADWI